MLRRHLMGDIRDSQFVGGPQLDSSFCHEAVKIVRIMNYFVSLLLVVVCAAVSKADDELTNAMVTKAFNKCRDQFPMSDDEIARVKEKVHVPDSRNAKCLMSCMLKEGKILMDGKYSLENALMMADILNKDNPDMAGKSKQLVQTCAGQVGTDASADECEFAYKMAICAAGEAKKLGVKPPDF